MADQSCRVFIAGAGPAGLAAALMFIKRGWRDVVIAERRHTADEFERGKAFNYQLDGRGQRILEQVGIGAGTLRRYGLPNDHFTQLFINPDGSTRHMSFPALLPDRKTPYWMTRAYLLQMLQEALEAQNTDGAVRILYGTSLRDVQRDTSGAHHLVLDHADGTSTTLRTPLVLGCDGLNSALRESMQRLAETSGGAVDPHHSGADYGRTVHPSPAAELAYKVLSFPPSFTVRGGDARIDDHTLAYCFLSSFKKTGQRMALFALPVPHATDRRNINIILHGSHEFWALEGSDAVLDYLTRAFPQLDFDAVLERDELESFAALKAGYFPEPQYANRIHYSPSETTSPLDCLLIGDAAHAFPPDLGMGVNSALEEVFILGELLNEYDEDISATCHTFEARRLPENKALVRLVQRTHPYQYNQVPWRLKFWFLRFLLQKKLHQWSGGGIPEPGFVLSQKHLLNFVEMERLKKKADRAFCTALAIPLLVLVWLL